MNWNESTSIISQTSWLISWWLVMKLLAEHAVSVSVLCSKFCIVKLQHWSSPLNLEWSLWWSFLWPSQLNNYKVIMRWTASHPLLTIVPLYGIAFHDHHLHPSYIILLGPDNANTLFPRLVCSSSVDPHCSSILVCCEVWQFSGENHVDCSLTGQLLHTPHFSPLGWGSNIEFEHSFGGKSRWHIRLQTRVLNICLPNNRVALRTHIDSWWPGLQPEHRQRVPHSVGWPQRRQQVCPFNVLLPTDTTREHACDRRRIP